MFRPVREHKAVSGPVRARAELGGRCPAYKDGGCQSWRSGLAGRRLPPDSHIQPPLSLGIPRRRAISENMCHGHPHYHSCSHTSLKWLYCPEAVFDLETGYEAPCANPIYSSPQPSSSDCPLQHCHFKALRGNNWTCCQCGNNTNTKGWCTGTSNDGGDWPESLGMEPQQWHTCGHGCCNNCSRNGTFARTDIDAEHPPDRIQCPPGLRRPKCSSRSERERAAGSPATAQLGALTKEARQWTTAGSTQ